MDPHRIPHIIAASIAVVTALEILFGFLKMLEGIGLPGVLTFLSGGQLVCTETARYGLIIAIFAILIQEATPANQLRSRRGAVPEISPNPNVSDLLR